MEANKKTLSANNRRLDSTSQLAEIMGKTPRYVKKLADDGLIPFISMPGKDRLFDREKVFTALSRFEVKAVGQ